MDFFHKAIEQSGAEELMGMSLSDRQAVGRVAELTLQNFNLSAGEVDKLQTRPYEQALSELGNIRLYPEAFWPDAFY